MVVSVLAASVLVSDFELLLVQLEKVKQNRIPNKKSFGKVVCIFFISACVFNFGIRKWTFEIRW